MAASWWSCPDGHACHVWPPLRTRSVVSLMELAAAVTLPPPGGLSLVSTAGVVLMTPCGCEPPCWCVQANREPSPQSPLGDGARDLRILWLVVHVQRSGGRVHPPTGTRYPLAVWLRCSDGAPVTWGVLTRLRGGQPGSHWSHRGLSSQCPGPGAGTYFKKMFLLI